VPRTDDQGDSPVLSESLELVLAEARQLGFLGPGPLAQQVRHAKGFVMVARPLFVTTSTPRLVDMGAGGGLPGLVVAQQWPEVSLVLLEANERRSTFLRRVVDRLEFADRVSILQERAEICGRDPEWRATFDGAIARSFGRPAVLAECAAPLLKPGAWVVVSEPPTSTQVTTSHAPARPGPPGTEAAERWPAGALRQFGLDPGQLLHAEFDYQLLRQVEICPERFPRRNGVPAKKPLF
jgi:16S rRNA (guanine527-N7)-methyltransferase